MLKRLWDTENKKAVWAMPAVETQAEIGRIVPMQVWTDDDWSKLYVYSNSQYREIFSAGTTVETYWPVWKELEDETVGYYLTNEPTDLYSWDEGGEVAYTFKNYDGTVLDEGTIDEWETPEYTGETPEKPADEENEYTFSGWKPTVKAIYKKTTYTAQYTATPIEDENVEE